MNLNSILVGSEEPKRLVDFYTKLFGDPTWDDGAYAGRQIGTGLCSAGRQDQVKGANEPRGRIIGTMETADVQGDFDRLRSAGATVVQEPYTPGDGSDGDMSIATFADPDGNYFQLVSPM